MTAPQYPFYRRVVRLAGRALAAGAALVFVLLAAGGLRALWGRRQVREFCGHVAIGQPVADLERAAEVGGFRFSRLPGDGGPEGRVLVIDGFSRWSCEVTHRAGKVSGARAARLD